MKLLNHLQLQKEVPNWVGYFLIGLIIIQVIIQVIVTIIINYYINQSFNEIGFELHKLEESLDGLQNIINNF